VEFEFSVKYSDLMWCSWRYGGCYGSKFEYLVTWRAAWEACSATWNLGTNSAFALGLRKTTENLNRVFCTLSIVLSFIEREKVGGGGGVVRDTTIVGGGGSETILLECSQALPASPSDRDEA
jgi:hypothetical protein